MTWAQRERAGKNERRVQERKWGDSMEKARHTNAVCGPERCRRMLGRVRGEKSQAGELRFWRKKKRKLFCAPSVRHGNATGSKPKTDFGRVQANFSGSGGMSSGREIPRVPKTQNSVP